MTYLRSCHNGLLPWVFPIALLGAACCAAENTAVTNAQGADLRRYDEIIRELEQSGGAYSYPMGQELVGLGFALRTHNQLDRAADAFNRALTIIRVNQGLESPEQLAVLDLLIDTNQARADWEQLDANYRYLHWLNDRIHRDSDPGSYWETTTRLVRWHLQAYRNFADPIPFKHLLSLDELYQSALDVMQLHSGPDDPRLVEALNGIALANYHIATYIAAMDNNSYEEVRTSSLRMDRPEAVTEQYLARQTYALSIVNNLNSALRRSVEILSRDTSRPVAERARALVNLADWYLLSGWDGRAADAYRDAFTLLQAGAAADSIREELFGAATRLPAIREPAWCVDPAPAQAPYIDLEFEVRRDGTVRSARITATSELVNPVMMRKRARDYLRASRFRPLFENGKEAIRHHAEIRLSGAVLETGMNREYPGYPCTVRDGRDGDPR